MSKPSKNTRTLNPAVFYLDQNLGSEKLAALLRPAGFDIVTHRERYQKRQDVLDPELIKDCGINKNILITADGDMETTWAAEILTAKIGVVILKNNNDGAPKWAMRIIFAKQEIQRMLKKYRKPLAARLSVDGCLTQVRLYRKRQGRVIKLRENKQQLLTLPVQQAGASVQT